MSRVKLLDEDEDARYQRRVNELMWRYAIGESFERVNTATGGHYLALDHALEEHPDDILRDVDIRSLLTDILRDFYPIERYPGVLPHGALEELRVEGDHATCRIGGTPCWLVRVDSRWFLEDYNPFHS